MARDWADRDRFLALLRETRRRKGVTQVELAARLGQHQSFVSKYETGERRLDFLEVREICGALQVSFPGFVRRYEALTEADTAGR